MIGHVDELRQPRVEITLLGTRGEVTTDAVIDTGFDGDLSIPIQLAIEIGLELWGITIVELADGSRKQELVFTGEMKLEKDKQKIDIFLTDSKDALLGTNLLSNAKLEVNFVDKTVEIIFMSKQQKMEYE